MNKTFSISEAISFGWHTFKTNWKFWIIVVFLVGIGGGVGFGGSIPLSKSPDPISQESYPLYSPGRFDSVLGTASTRLLADPGSSRKDASILDSPLPLIVVLFAIVIAVFCIFSALVSTTMRMGYINLTLDAARSKQVYYKTLLNQVSLRKAYRFLAVTFAVGLVTFLGLLLLVIPGIYFALKYSFAGYALVDGDLKIGEALKKSARITKGIKMRLLGLGIVICLLSLLAGPITLGIGFIVMMVVSSLAFSYVYVKMADAEISVPILQSNL